MPGGGALEGLNKAFGFSLRENREEDLRTGAAYISGVFVTRRRSSSTTGYNRSRSSVGGCMQSTARICFVK